MTATERKDPTAPGKDKEEEEMNRRGGLGALASLNTALEIQQLWEEVDESSRPSHPDRPIPESNPGFQILLRMGWEKGRGLGRRQEGRKEPVRLACVVGKGGLGIERVYDEMGQEATASRQLLESERQLQETAEETRQRLERAEMQQRTKEAVERQNRAFYCEDCRKQYTTAMQWEEHLSSYDHHHRKRLLETRRQAALRRGTTRLGSSATNQRLQEEALQQQMLAAGVGSSDSSRAATGEGQDPDHSAEGGPEGRAGPALAEQSTALSSTPRSSVKLTFGSVALRGGKKLGRRKKLVRTNPTKFVLAATASHLVPNLLMIFIPLVFCDSSICLFGHGTQPGKKLKKVVLKR